MVGDYISTSWSAGKACGVFAVANALGRLPSALTDASGPGALVLSAPGPVRQGVFFGALGAEISVAIST